LVKTSIATASSRAALDCLASLQAGFTSIRELGGLGIEIRVGINEGTIPGPNIYSAGGALSITGGHGDLHDLPYDIACQVMGEFTKLTICDGPWEAVKATRVQMRRGADLIKVMCSGGVLSERDSPLHQEFSDTELDAIVKEARSKDRVVAAHCHGEEGLKAAIRAGVHTIEHGSFLDKKLCQEMKDKGIILVPTLYVVRKIMSLSDKIGLSKSNKEKMNMVAKSHQKAIQTAIETGVTIALGSDILTSGVDSAIPWGENAMELQYLVESGMTTGQALTAATAHGPLTLGPYRTPPKSGVLKASFDADLLVLWGDPLVDIQLFQNKKKIAAVFKSGLLMVYQGTLVTPQQPLPTQPSP